MSTTREMTELELDLTAKLAIARTHITFLVKYANRVAMHQITQQDIARVREARMFAAQTEDAKNG